MEADIFWKLSTLTKFGVFGGSKDTDWSDRLNYQVTTLIHVVFMGIITVRSQFGKPIQCWFPQEYSKTWQDYSEMYCWISGTYYIPMKDDPQMHDPKSHVINYYQWSSVVLGIQTLFFILPCVIWRFLSTYSHFPVSKLMKMSNHCHLPVSYENYLKNIQLISNNFYKCIRHSHHAEGKGNENSHFEVKQKSRFCRFSGQYLFHLYLFTKLLYIGNIFAQIYGMTIFLGFKDHFFGIKLLQNIITGKEWMESGNFPRVTFCEISAVKLGGPSIHHIQCLLPINMFLEKIYTFLWFYYVLIGTVTIFNFFSWIIQFYIFKNRFRIIKRNLKISNAINGSENILCKNFVSQYLQMDGVFLLHLIAINIGEVIANDITLKLWNSYRCRSYISPILIKKSDSPQMTKSKASHDNIYIDDIV